MGETKRSRTRLLAQEQRYFRQIKAELLKKHDNKYALIKGRRLLGTFDTPKAAYEVGLARLGNVPMLIVHIQKQETKDWIPALQSGLMRATVQG